MIEFYKNQMPRHSFLLGLPPALMNDAMAKRFGVSQAAIARSQARMETAGRSLYASTPASSIDEDRFQDEVAEAYANVGRRGWHNNAVIRGCATPLGQRIPFPERDAVKWSVYADTCTFNYDDQLCTLQDSHEDHANIYAVGMDFKVHDGALYFSTRRIPKNETTDVLIDHSHGVNGLKGMTCSVSCRVVESHGEVQESGYAKTRELVQVVTSAFIQHVELIPPWKNEYPWQPHARAANTYATITIYRD